MLVVGWCDYALPEESLSTDSCDCDDDDSDDENMMSIVGITAITFILVVVNLGFLIYIYWKGKSGGSDIKSSLM